MTVTQMSVLKKEIPRACVTQVSCINGKLAKVLFELIINNIFVLSLVFLGREKMGKIPKL